MSSEVCPFCGKTYKRLKSHLPHCKAAANPKTPPTPHDVTANPATAASQLASVLSEKKTTQTKKSTKVSDVSSVSPPSLSPTTSLKNVNTSSDSQPASSSPISTSLPPSTKKKKLKLSDQIKMANITSSTSLSPSLSPSPALSKPKKQSLRALIDAAKSNQLSKGQLEGTGISSLSPVTSPLSSVTKTNPDRDTFAHAALPSTDAKPKRASKKKVSQSLSKTKNTSASRDSTVSKSRAKGNFWEDSEGEKEDLSGNEILWKSESSSHQAKVTLQDVKTILRRPKTSGQSSGAGILGQIESSLSPVPTENRKDDISHLVTTKPLSNQLPSTSLQPKALTPAKRKKSKQASLILLQDDGSLHSKLSSPGTPLLSDHLSSQMSQATLLPPTVSLKTSHHMTSLTQFSNPPRFPLATQTLSVRVETVEKPQFEARRENARSDGAKGDLNQRCLGQVRLRELPDWLACKTPTHPRDVVQIMQRGWQWYYKRYIDVKRGSVGGLGMLLAGYCVLSYIWSYPHIKRDRWRKYH
ncbi:uncharacterized protein si:dkey-21c1.4 isoform X2 [Scomber scombrus]|uniref:uncharacterized protein si:dkey-21c1.4 isoform X2 n=1 Tax=Scomber scombrus TaxID=13677 RepID=UPI002DD8DDBF|nr:uncharacterized protein si:dkey-21c1.4 isoform X2 [Scomber scombrus]